MQGTGKVNGALGIFCKDGYVLYKNPFKTTTYL